MCPTEKLVWLHGEVETPPFSKEARLEAGFLLRRLQRGELLSLPASRPMPTIGRGCHELRVNDARKSWRLVYAVEHDAIVLLEAFEKKTEKAPKQVIDSCRERLMRFRHTVREEESR
ncbi:MAG: type II toxin-antitoxin system RelE/ParE family toxin [Thermoanaerobaculia bacterium]